MKRFATIAAVILIVGSTLFIGCEREYYKPAATIQGTINFATDIVPLFTTNCNASGCHSGSVAPNLTASNAYSNLINGAYIDTANPEQSKLYLKMNSNMPPSGKLPAADIQKVLIWIQQGAQNN